MRSWDGGGVQAKMLKDWGLRMKGYRKQHGERYDKKGRKQKEKAKGKRSIKSGLREKAQKQK